MVYFTDFFNVDENKLEEYGAFNISLINDLPLFIDPFLLFGSKRPEYKQMHEAILEYLSFLKNKSQRGGITEAEIKSWYMFSEVKQNWLGFSVSGNGGSGLGEDFGNAMSKYMHIVFDDLYKEKVTVTSHLEKAGLFQIGVGKDNISDFTCNLLKLYLLEYTQTFATQNLNKNQVKKFTVRKVYFDYKTECWMSQQFILPVYSGDFILLTPKDLLTKDDNWINSHDLRGNFVGICNSISNLQLRNDIQNYFRSKLPAPKVIGKGKRKRQKPPTQKELSLAINETIKIFPKILNYYIKLKEENKEGAKNVSEEKVQEVEVIFKENVIQLINHLINDTKFYDIAAKCSYEESLKRVEYLKDVIENKDGYKLFYYRGQPLKREADLQVIYRLTWFSSPYDINREVNNGRGFVDYTVSKGSEDKTLVEFKLASNNKLKMNLQNQINIYEVANDTKKSIKVIMYFEQTEYLRTMAILKELNLDQERAIVLIDAGGDKPSASKVKQK
jgi:hypothetical protein